MSKSWKNTRLWCKGSPRFACHSNPFLYPSIFSFLRRSEKVQLIFGSNSLLCQFQTCYLKHFLHSITAIIDLVLSYFMNEGCFDILFIFNKDFVSKFAGDSKSSNLALQIMKNMIEMINGDCDVGRTPRPAPCPVKAFCSVILPGFSQAANPLPGPQNPPRTATALPGLTPTSP